VSSRSDSLADALADRYRIEGELGRGGMATVYLAEDLKHKRRVAVKVLHAEHSAAVGKERFLREITTAANLTHPHIVPVFDSGDADGRLYFVMPLIEGETLRARLEREGPLPVEEAIRLVRQVANGLAYAHGAGILHRDLKPENIMLSRGHAVLADFGIAGSTIGTTQQPRLTQTGTSLGTAAYMSPEQATGEREIGPPSDVYGLGSVLYELLTGEAPFSGPTFEAILVKRFTQDAPRCSSRRADTPAGCDAAVAKALAREPGDRFATVRAFAEAIATIQAPVAATTARRVSERSIVVLPFANLSPDPDNGYFSDGLTEEIISDLSRLRALRVISRSSSMTLKGTTADTASIANQLGVTHIVTGSVRRAGDALRVTVELIEATSDSSLWSEKYSGTMADVFGIQEEIAQKIVAALEVGLTESEAAEAKVVQWPIQDVVAWDCYLRARQELYAWTPDSMDRAARLVEEALRIVGDNPLLLATQGQIAYMKVNLMFDPDERHLDRAAEYADRALAIAPDYYLGLFLRGVVAGLRGDTASAIRDTYRAHQLRPGDPNVLAEFCRFGNAAGVEVAAHVNELVRIDPLTPVTWLVVALNRSQYGQIEEVIEPSRRCLSLAPGVSMFPIFVARLFAKAGLREEAIELLDQAGKTLAGTLHGSWALFLRYAQAGAAEAAVSHMTPLLERGASMGDNIAIIIAEGYSLIGRNEDALKWIRIGMNRGFLHYPFLADGDPLLASVRSDAGFPDLMQEVKTRWEALGRSLPHPLRLAPPPKEHP
jgi:eukaryotic-like serine/threonine-protein kinase